MELGVIKKGDEEIEGEISFDGSVATQSNEDNDIKILKWQFELMLNAMEDTKGSK